MIESKGRLTAQVQCKDAGCRKLRALLGPCDDPVCVTCYRKRLDDGAMCSLRTQSPLPRGVGGTSSVVVRVGCNIQSEEPSTAFSSIPFYLNRSEAKVKRSPSLSSGKVCSVESSGLDKR